MTEGRTGLFWLAGRNSERYRGELRLLADRWHLDTEEPLFQSAAINVQADGSYSYLGGNPTADAQDTKPRLLFGRLDDGTDITLPDAQAAHMTFGRDLGPLHWSGPRTVEGAHISGNSEQVTAIRWAVSGLKGPWGTEGTAVPCASGSIAPHPDPAVNGLTLSFSEARSLRTALYAPGRITSLFRLGGYTGAEASNFQVQLQDDSWANVLPSESKDLERKGFIPATDFTLDLMAHWETTSAVLGPIPYLVLDSAEFPVQLQAQVLATALEGTHRRLFGRQSVFPDLSRRSTRRVISAAVAAAVKQFESEGGNDAEQVASRFSGALGHVDDMNYVERVTDLLQPVEEVVPGLFGPSLEGWAQLAKVIRNVQSHQLDSHDIFDDAEISEYIVIMYSARLALRIALLLRVFEPSRLRDLLANSLLVRDAVAQLDAEGLWPDFSCTETYLAGLA